MAIIGIELCLSTILACVIVCAPVIESRSLRRHHHSRLNDPVQVPVSRDPSRLEDDVEYRDSYKRVNGRRYRAIGLLDYSSEYENMKERMETEMPSILARSHRYRHEYDLRNDPRSFVESSSRRRKEMRRYDRESSNKLGARRKRHNKHGSTVNYRKSTEQDKKDMLLSRQHDQELEFGENDGLHESYELEVKEAQNSSICNYTVVSIPDIRGNRVPKDLEHVMCNHAGSSCQSTGSYCCIQTYRNIEVSYGDNDKETMKLYVGCVCALQVFNGLQVAESPLRIHD